MNELKTIQQLLIASGKHDYTSPLAVCYDEQEFNTKCQAQLEVSSIEPFKL